MIFYFSGTGNSRWAAEELARRTGERLLFIPQELQGDCAYQLDHDERIGFCFPVHGWQPPHIVREFVNRLRLSIPSAFRPYVYVVCTCGDSIGRTIEMFQHDLGRLGLGVDSAFSLTMPESYVCLPFMYTDTPQREREKISQARTDLDTYATMIIDRVKGERHTVRGLMPWIMSHVIGAYFNGRMITDRKFRVDAQRCTHCGKCQKVCPTGDLDFRPENNGDKHAPALPHWRHDGSCTCCLACYHHCPQHAIEYGSFTPKRGQYYYGHNTSYRQEAENK